MTIHLGYVAANSTLYIPFHTFNASGASVTISGLAVTDIEIYKNGSVTQRASDAGYALLDTDGIDFDGLTGIHGFSIDLSDNTDAGFYSAGGFFWVVVSAVTVDSQTVSFVAATFSLSQVPANLTHVNGTAATSSSGRPEVNTSHWAGTAVGSTTVRADLINIAGAAVSTTTAQLGVNAVQISGDGTAADNLETAFDDTAGAVRWMAITDQGTAQSATGTTLVLRAAAAFADDELIGQTLVITGGSTGVGQSRLITDYVSATDTATVDTWTTTPTGTITYRIFPTATGAAGGGPTAAEIADAVWDEAASGHTTGGSFGAQCGTDIDAILADTNEVQISLAAGGLIESMVDDLQTEVDGIQADTEDIQSRLPAALVNSRMDCTIDGTGMEAGAVTAVQSGLATAAALDTVDNLLDTEVGAIKTVVDAIQAKTDSLTFTVAGQVDANVQRINDVAITGDGQPGTEFGV